MSKYEPDQPLGLVQVSNWTLLRWLIAQGLRYPWRCLELFGLNLTILLIGLAGLTLIGLEFDVLRHAADGTAPVPRWRGLPLPQEWLARPLRLVIGIAAAIILWALLRCGLRIYASRRQGRLVQNVLSHVRSSVYDKLQRLSFRFFDANQTGSLINRATGDAVAVASFADWALVQLGILFISLVINLVYMISIHVSLTLVCLGSTPLLLIASMIFSKIVRPGYDESRRLYDKLILTLSENIQGQHVVKGFACQDEEIRKFAGANGAFRDQQRWLFTRSSAYSAIAQTLTQVNLILVLAYGGYLVAIHHGDPNPPITVGKLIVFASLLGQFSGQVAGLADINNFLQACLTSAHRVYEVLHAPLEIRNAPDAVRRPRLEGRVESEHVFFGYTPDTPVLHDLNFAVAPGKTTAILGATGSGKSALLSLIPRFYDPTRGRILIDGTDAREIELGDLRRNVGLVFQESFLFSNTVGSNIAFGNPDATRDDIARAARLASAHDFIMALPKGYDTLIGEQGATLSGGQRQRLAIARAILPDPAILILDDALAAVDPETEHEILEAMGNAMKGRTTFVVAHRLSTLRRADLVLVLEEGRLVQMGTHEQLMRTPGYYREIARLQVADKESRHLLQVLLWDRGEVRTPFSDAEDLE